MIVFYYALPALAPARRLLARRWGDRQLLPRRGVPRDNSMAEPRVEIVYCTQCRWMLRAAWMAQELLATFAEELGEVALVPGKGGTFEVRVQGELVWSRQAMGRFPEIKELKQRVRDVIAPAKDLGHSEAPRVDADKQP